ncbi:uncharacterized protein LOC131620786 [Vicia villosa]|uniref:uncharacterized protein LOC131620786 n=1 Tax=Vicia villosa TaxID=3911 RepID=UPI00273C7FF5|nr:uncharacterized protein LOC131620786 [Vicia villosa]
MSFSSTILAIRTREISFTEITTKCNCETNKLCFSLILFMNYNTPGKMVGPTIIVLTHARCKINTVSGARSLSSAWSGSRLLINVEHPQIDEFKASYGGTENSNAPSLSLTCESSLQSANKSGTNLNEVKSIRAIKEGKKDCFATTIGTTKHFKASRFGWFFESCPGCRSSNKSQGETFECACRITNVEPVTKFKVEVELEYDNYKGTFVFWDKDVIPYTKLSAKELRAVMKEAGEENPKIWPVHLDVLLNKQMVFRIKYQSSFEQFSIVAILNEDNLFNTFDNHLCPNELTSNAAVVGNESNTPTDHPIQPIVTHSDDLELTAQPALDVNRSGSPTASSSSTPAKRVAASTYVNEPILAEELTPKQSATKAKAGKKIKHIKKE